MEISAKNHLIIWCVLVIISLFLWYRDNLYDRIISILIFFIALVELVQYGIQSGADVNTSNKIIFVLLWLQCFMLALAVFVFFKNNENKLYRNFSTAIMFIFGIILLISILFVIIANPDFSNNQGNLLGYFNLIYIIGLILPLIILLSYYNYSNIGLIVLICYIILLAGIVLLKFDIDHFNTYYNYFLIVIAFITFVSGMITSLNNPNTEVEI